MVDLPELLPLHHVGEGWASTKFDTIHDWRRAAFMALDAGATHAHYKESHERGECELVTVAYLKDLRFAGSRLVGAIQVGSWTWTPLNRFMRMGSGREYAVTFGDYRYKTEPLDGYRKEYDEFVAQRAALQAAGI